MRLVIMQRLSSALPKYDTVNKRVDFTGNTANKQTGSANAFFNIPNGGFSYGSGDYSFIMKMGTINTGSVFPLYSAGAYGIINGVVNSMTVLANYPAGTTTTLDSWYSNNCTLPANTFTDNCVASTTYSTSGNSNSTRYWYVTGKSAITASVASGAAKNITNTNNYIGTGVFAGYTYYFYKGHIGFFYWAPISLSTSDRNILESTT